MEKRHSPTYWRDRADELRSMAETFENVDTKRLLSDIAADFDQLAKLPAADISKAIGAWDGTDARMPLAFCSARPLHTPGRAALKGMP
jgi:hypothetical protein